MEHKNNPFGYQDTRDISQDIWVICLEALKSYDPAKPAMPNRTLEENLERFLRVIVKNRLINRFKEMTKTVRSPCPKCPFYALGRAPGDCNKFGEDKYSCDKWRNYRLSVDSRNSLLNAAEEVSESIDYVEPESSSNELDLQNIIESYMPSHLLQDFKSLSSGQKLSKVRHKEIIECIYAILEKHCKDYGWADLFEKFSQKREEFD